MIIRNVCFLLFGVLLLFPKVNFAQKDKNLKSVNTDLEFPCPPDQIRITRFMDIKNWKIVVNRPFDYKAFPKNNTDNWQWSMGDLNAAGNGVDSFWIFQNQLNAYKGTGIIPLNNLPPDNSDFGPAHGHVEATANLNGVLRNDITDIPGQTVKVFFNKDEIHPVSGTPNWFHYWSDIGLLGNLLTIPSIPVFDFDSCSFVPQPPPNNNTVLSLTYNPALNYDPVTMIGTFGENQFFPITSVPAVGCPGFDRVMANFDPAGNALSIGPGCGQAEINPNDPNNPHRGIHVFYRTVAHEAEHARIATEVWNTGYASNRDMDDDEYRDDWETEFNNNPPLGACYQFTIGVPGSMNDTVGAYQAHLLGQCPPHAGHTAGTEYEETRCINVENALNLEAINPFDWSFDPMNINQGKQW